MQSIANQGLLRRCRVTSMTASLVRDESGANQRQEPSSTETVIPRHGLLGVDRAACNG